MNYYYDIILNWNELEAYEFYEWNDFDCLELIKKIPIFKVRHKVLIDLMSYNIEVQKEFLELIKDKTLTSGKSIVNKIPYAAIFTDNKNLYALEFNDEGLSINRSKLLIDDDLNALEICYSLKEYNLIYELKEPLKINKEIRQITEAKKLISLELNSLYEKKDIAKLKYLYYEYKKEKIDDLSLLYTNLKLDLESKFNPEILKLYYIIKLSYHNV